MQRKLTERLATMAGKLKAAHVALTMPDFVLIASTLLVEARDRIEELEDEKRQRQKGEGE